MQQWYTLALDLATRTGWAVSEGSVIIASGTFDLSASTKALHREGMKIFLLEQAFRENRFHEFINEIVIEDIMVFKGKNSIQSQRGIASYFFLQGKVFEYCRAIGINPPTLINPMTLKLQFAGTGKASKEDMGRELEARGWTGAVWDKAGNLVNNDEADALALLFVNADNKSYPMSFLRWSSGMVQKRPYYNNQVCTTEHAE
jgi:hypothetical protein